MSVTLFGQMVAIRATQGIHAAMAFAHYLRHPGDRDEPAEAEAQEVSRDDRESVGDLFSHHDGWESEPIDPRVQELIDRVDDDMLGIPGAADIDDEPEDTDRDYEEQELAEMGLRIAPADWY